ncbi:MAG: protein translocase subunit SecD [Bacillota bacterium]
MKASSGVKSFLVVAIIGVLTYIAFAGFSIPGMGFKLKNANDNMRYGIDIKGGVRAVLTAPDGVTPTTEQMETARSIVEKRLDAKQIYDKTVTIEKSTNRILIEIPWKNDEKDYDPQKTVLDGLGNTALLTFRKVDETKFDAETGQYEPGEIILQGDDIVDAKPVTDPQTGGMDVGLVLSDAGAKKFEKATGEMIGKIIAIYLDDQMISAPRVQSKITGKDNARITLGGDPEKSIDEAKNLSALIRAGALPFKLEARDVNSISPILGANALRVSQLGGLVALMIVWAFMLLYYRLPGVVACIALLGQVVGQILIIAFSHITLTLPGIAGIILTIGMSVDANIIIFERVKEEIRNGKTVQAAIDVGFKRAFTAILDGNITTLIAAAVLYVLGTGPIQSFALTLGLGVMLNFVTAIFATRIMLNTISGFSFGKKTWLYGVKGGAANV